MDEKKTMYAKKHMADSSTDETDESDESRTDETEECAEMNHILYLDRYMEGISIRIQLDSSCDVCGKIIHLEPKYSCRKCDLDYCISCYNIATPPNKVEIKFC
jgi:hypothetical protein